MGGVRLIYTAVVCLLLSLQTVAQPIVLTPKWTAQAQFAGYYVADKMGFYREEGVDVKILHPAVSESSFSYLQDGRAQAVVMNLSYALMVRKQGAKVVNVMQTSQENSLRLVSRKPLNGIASLKHQKIAVWNHLSEELLEQLNRHFDLQAEWIRFNGGVNLFLSGAVDICLVGTYNECLQLSECGMEVDSSCVCRFIDYGYNLPEDGLYVTEEFYRTHPEEVKKLVRASIRGWKWANEHREDVLDMVMEEVRRYNIGTNRYHQRRMLEEILRLQAHPRSGERTYQLSREDFNVAVEILLQQQDQLRYEDFVK